eukprot:CAMPEP_0113928164 /NCGR_PEP_ID=MMETSP1159-20121227/4677_1 /TAXON_ID=88271 /ORGANISM="Picocystis salinarum" /LENGTH=69 /DNA_ID=CAMNT_0000928675 /DNA_START=171 /DNA_END=377 /DNA_ORIENTATION=- /assembly_acc=CAM_ASM_000767
MRRDGRPDTRGKRAFEDSRANGRTGTAPTNLPANTSISTHPTRAITYHLACFAPCHAHDARQLTLRARP